MEKVISILRSNIYDKFMIAHLRQDKETINKLINEYNNDLYEEVKITINDDKIVKSYEEIEYVQNILNNELDELGNGIYGGIHEGHLYAFDFNEKSVTISENLVSYYTFLPEKKRVWFFSDFVKGVYIYANYETGEIIAYIGDEADKEKALKVFDPQKALRYILNFSGAPSLEELFSYHLNEDIQ